MEKKPVLVVLAAGMGSRYGGLKQIDPVGSQGEAILDYSIYDAHRAGFDTVVIVIKKAIEKDFMETVGKRLEKAPVEIRYAFQELEDLPEGFSVPEDRTKPWGTSHAVLCAAKAIDGAPFAVINADDFYGASAYRVVYDYLTSCQDPNAHCVVGYERGKTVTDHGSVSRGICEADEQGLLTRINERKVIEKYENGIAWTYPLKGTHIPTIKNNGNVMRVTNNGLVELSANSAYSTSGITGAKGRVDNTNISTRATISKDETIFVKVTAAANVKDLNDKLQNASAELVVFENAGSLTLDAADLAENKTTFELVIPEVEVRGNLDITTPAGYTLNIHAVSIGTKFKVLSGTTKLTARTKVDLGTTNRGAYVTVEEGAKLEVENNAELTSSCDLQFEGEGLIGNYGAITNVKKGEEPNLVEGSRDVVYKE